MKYTRIFRETNDDKVYCKMGGDSEIEIRKYDKYLPFGEMRQFLYSIYCDESDYIDDRNRLKMKNKYLHKLFYKNEKVSLITLLDMFSIEWKKYPYQTKILVTNARWLRHDGNCESLIACDDTHYYLVTHRGS